MPTLRDSLLTVVNQLRGMPQTFGLRRFAVTIVRRVWSGTYVGDGTPTDQNIVFSPLPYVRQSFAGVSKNPAALEYLLAKGNVVDDRIYSIERITPAYNNGHGKTGGYTAEQLRLWIPPDVKNVEAIVQLVGDDGLRRDCVQLSVAQDRAFRYSMVVSESDRPRTALASLAILPASPTVAIGASLQLQAIGTFADGGTSDLSALVAWLSSAPSVATVDLLGDASGISAGTPTITASLTGIQSTTTLTVS